MQICEIHSDVMLGKLLRRHCQLRSNFKSFMGLRGISEGGVEAVPWFNGEQFASLGGDECKVRRFPFHI